MVWFILLIEVCEFNYTMMGDVSNIFDGINKLDGLVHLDDGRDGREDAK